MTINYRNHQMNNVLPTRQKGALTMFSAVLILILLTGMVIYATQVGVFEQRKSGNELRQKQAFHAAEVGVQRGQEFFAAHALDLTSRSETRGWQSGTHMSAGGSGRWLPCAGRDESNVPHTNWHPCYGEALNGLDGKPNLRADSYFYSEDGTNATPIPIPITDNQDLMDRATEAAQVFALLCNLDVQVGIQQPVQGCLAPGVGNFDPVFFVITMLARGRSECDGIGNCRGEALVAQRLGSYGPVPGGGGPGVPLTSKTSLHPTGTIEIVPNPNGGGIGVPVSVWVDGEYPGGDRELDPIANCPPDEGSVALDPQSNSWATCEAHEWYGVDILPEDYTCPPGKPCDCAPSEQLISHGNQDGIRFDLIADPDFPCDLFFHVFEESDVDLVKDNFTVVDSCDDLGPLSRGPIWVDSGADCKFGAGRVIGSPTDPVFLVSSTPDLQIGGGAIIYGVVMTTDKEGRAGGFDPSGGGTVYGAILVDGQLAANYGSNFEIVWNDDAVRLATKRGSLGKLYGGWTDFHEEWR
jgi:hypothetical protein